MNKLIIPALIFIGGCKDSDDCKKGGFIDSHILTGGNSDIGSAIVTPEPNTWALLIVGLIAVYLLYQFKLRGNK